MTLNERPSAIPSPSTASGASDGVNARFDIAADVIARWQRLVDLMAEVVGVPAGLIMQCVGQDIQVLVSSRTVGNPYRAGDAALLMGSGLYCETVINSGQALRVSNALASARWRNNPDTQLDMISYLGFPIRWPDRSPFGTICVLDCKENVYSERYARLISEFRDQIESHLQLVQAELMAECERNTVAQLADDLRRQKEIAEEACRVKSSFLAAASHDLRQPVHALNLFVGALRHVPMPADGVRLVEQIDASIIAMDELFTAILDISRLDAGVVPVHRSPFAIGALLDRVCRDLAVDAEAKGLRLSTVRCGAAVDSDPMLIERIVRNLVSNAVRYTDTGRIVVGCRRTRTHVLMRVYDTGRGIPADQQSRIFDDYYQLGNPGREREKGVGLGLAIVRRLADLLECKLTLRSEPGRGSCFEVALKRANGVASVIEPRVDELDTGPSTGLVVVIDDELAIRSGMSSLLTYWGYRVITASSTDEAIRLLATCAVRPALLICDLRLRGDENGLDAIERLRDEYNTAIPALLITGDTAAGRLTEPHRSGFVLLHKPVPNAKLRAVVMRAIAAG